MNRLYGDIFQLIALIAIIVLFIIQAYLKACKEMKKNKKFIEESKTFKPTLSDETLERLKKNRQDKAMDIYKKSVIEMECPNCGAPLKSLYQPCEYCGVRCNMTGK